MIDWARVTTLRNDIGADAFDEVVDIFLEEVQEVIDKLHDAPVPAELEHDLHALKNGALNLGFGDLSQLCQTGEKQAAAGNADCVDLQEIIQVFGASRQHFLQGLPDILAA